MKLLKEGFLQFEFSDNWHVFKLDDHPSYRKRIAKLTGTKAVDFIGILNQSSLYLIEVKDFREHRIENKKRLESEDLAIEVGQKVRDSLACIVGAYRTSNQTEIWTPFMQLLNNKNKQIKVVIWLEHNLPPHPKLRAKSSATILSKKFKNKLGWLTPKVLVCNQVENILPDVRVRNLARNQKPKAGHPHL